MSTSVPQDFNYAKYLGIESTPAAIVFAVIYAPLTFYFVYTGIRRWTYVIFALVLFTTIRVVAFSMRAALAHSESVGENLNVYIGYQVLSSIGFIGLLYSAYILVLDREIVAEISQRKGILNKITGDRRIFRLIMTAGTALGIAGASTMSGNFTTGTSISLRIASAAIFFVLTVVQMYRTILLIISKSDPLYKPNYPTSFGEQHGHFILGIIALFLLLRMTFVVATTKNILKQDNEHFWYPLVALPEILAVIAFCPPGVVPTSSSVKEVESNQMNEV